ncbi:hypothetical protein JQX09_17955 [Sulfitobacter pseudonitzschiae]|uniref:Uncharacterized protein n=1 Tax=Pseudosulfitobacter pseudonitzschiae TaxID=1402135 RepID=A0A9Q2NT23_9RHOB|nr:hypothetical protein [Pseudosulfitobacter pseudonitzschiae]MBM2293816.1 hypothetical protein [Pseudosulfitobacter pseudonitzschiae]MBM2298733.1 hypothetical protein [Pseudosulfitobacter pseudonitzschiae]MBM2303648.1 hypothetical protein [Pseudosulfitobacter pseudonitzschiae]MBM2313430.1 hypothetical protein [Pseudosulfitobacter pseudonitzschiae]MBM2318344.1 hypothetical protein [Pseudosulfitobacter pseudonitzschiae]
MTQRRDPLPHFADIRDGVEPSAGEKMAMIGLRVVAVVLVLSLAYPAFLIIKILVGLYLGGH